MLIDEDEKEIDRLIAGMRTRDASARRFPWMVLLVFTTLVVTYLGSSATVNPRLEFPGPQDTPLLLEQPFAKFRYHEDLQSPATTVVLGASNVMTLDPSEFQRQGFGPTYNFAYSRSLATESLAVQRFLADTDRNPGTIIQGVADFQFAVGYQGRARVTAELAERFREPDSLTSSLLIPMKASMKPAAVLDLARVTAYNTLGMDIASQYAIDDDGLFHYVERDRLIEAREYDLRLALEQSYPTAILPAYKAFDSPDSAQLEALSAQVALAETTNTTMYFVLPPIHPTVTAWLDRDVPGWRSAHDSIVAHLVGLCSSRVHVHDYTDPSSFGGNDASFYDPHHYYGDNARLVVEGLAAGRGDLCT
jgi:hypothetical protein